MSDTPLPTGNFNRPPRIHLPAIPREEVSIPPPPTLPENRGPGWLISIIPVLGIGVMGLFYLTRAGDGGSALFAIPLFVLAMFTIGGTILAFRWRKKDTKQRADKQTIDYVRVLDRKRARLQAAHNAQYAILRNNFPDPQTNLSRALSRNPNLWERRPDNTDFLAFRLGIGRIPSVVPISPPDPDVDSPELIRAIDLIDTYRWLENAPVSANLVDDFSTGFAGQRDIAVNTVRSIICHLAMTHTPNDLQIHLVAPQSAYDEWRWMEWLPHTNQGQGGKGDWLAFDNSSIRRLMGSLSQIVDERLKQPDAIQAPHLLLIVDDPHLIDNESVYSRILRDGEMVSASIICIVNHFDNIPGDCTTVVDIQDDGRFRCLRTGETSITVQGYEVDSLALSAAEHIARALSSVNMREVGGSGRIPRYVDFLELYGMNRVEEVRDVLSFRWNRPVHEGHLPYPIPLGRESLAMDTYLHLDEDHHGPHGVLAGTTGSGKSELLQTFVTALAIEHDPRLVNFLLIDFKGGSSFRVFEELPHTVGMVTNLDGVLVERALEALKSEIQSRQQFLKKTSMRDIVQYHRFYSRSTQEIQNPVYQPLPHLFVIVDEFAQLAKEMPTFLSELVRIAQVGRSLGLHLILGTQSPMDVITDEMNANLQFRICLRVQNAESSRAMLRRPDAAYLPAGWAGRGYFQVGERGVYKQFQTAYVGGDYEQVDHLNAPLVLELITEQGDAINLLPSVDENEDRFPNDEPFTTAHAITNTIIAYTERNHIPSSPPLLLPPLTSQITVAEPFANADIVGWNGQTWQHAGHDHKGNPIPLGSAPVGMIDDVYTQTQYPLWVHLNTSQQSDGRNGHVLVMGGPGTGKTTFLRTLAISQALLHSPDRLHMYFLSFTGSGLNDLGMLPHAEEVVHGIETERVRRLFGRLLSTLNERQAGIKTSHLPTIVLCVDQYEQLRDTYYEQHIHDFERLINEGRAVGIYVVITANSITSIPDRLRSMIQQRIALQLGNPTDYLLAVGNINTRDDEQLPKGRGWIYNSPPLICQISLPVRSTVVDNQDMSRMTLDILQELRRASRSGPSALRELPPKVPLDSLPLADPSEKLVTIIGRVDDDDLRPFALDWMEQGPHFLVTGPPGTGKTNLLQVAALSSAQQLSPEKLRIVLIDFTGRSLRSLEPLKHVVTRVTDMMELETQLNRLNREMSTLYQRWNDKEVIDDIPRTLVIIDDYEVVSDALSNNYEMFIQLRDHVRLHSELGLHFWVAGYLDRIGDPFIKQLLLRRSGFALSIKDSLHNLNIRTAGLSNETMPPGRAFYAEHNTVTVLQTAQVDNPQVLVNRVNQQLWRDHRQSVWGHIAVDESQATSSEPAITVEDKTQPTTDSELDIDTDGLIQDLLGD